jgi:hypothetical protein
MSEFRYKHDPALQRIGVRLIYCDERGNELATIQVLHGDSGPERKWAIPLDAQYVHVTFLWSIEP